MSHLEIVYHVIKVVLLVKIMVLILVLYVKVIPINKIQMDQYLVVLVLHITT